MFQGLTPSTTDFDTHLTGGPQMPFGCGGKKNYALQQPEIKSKKTIPALFT
jgi:hypothetical protein